MIPKLLDNTKSLSELVNDASEGLGRLAECTSAKTTEERNGAFTLQITLPMSARHFSEIKKDSIIVAKPNPFDDPQLFRVFKSTKPMNGMVTFFCNHISYDLLKTSVMPFQAVNASDAFSKLKTNMIGGSAFTFSTDKTTAADFKNEIPQSARALLGGQEGSFLDVFGGEFKFDNLQISLLASRGTETGTVIEYGKNLTDINQEENITDMYTAIVPYVKMSEDSKDETIVGDLINLVETDDPRIMNLDLSDRFEQTDTITKAKVNSAAAAYVAVHGNELIVPKINIKVSFVNLPDTDEYKNISSLENVRLCDSVTVRFEKLGVDGTAKIIKTVYDVLNEKYDSIQLGDVASGLAQTVSNIISTSKIQTAQQRKFIAGSIEKATALISGGLGGYVVMGLNEDGHPEEILIMDTPDKATAHNVIRMNQSGIGFSTHGYAGPYSTAWTIDGTFIANYIKAGTLDCGTLRNAGGDVSNVNASQLSTGTMDNDRAGGYNFSAGNDITVVNWDGQLCHYYFDHGIGMNYWLENDTSSIWYQLYHGQ